MTINTKSRILFFEFLFMLRILCYTHVVQYCFTKISRLRNGSWIASACKVPEFSLQLFRLVKCSLKFPATQSTFNSGETC